MTDWPAPIRIGSIEVDFPVLLAPLAGYSDLAYRRLCRRFGASYCTTEMILDRCVLARGRQHTDLIATDDGDHPVAGQLIGSDPAEMARGAVGLRNKGFDAVDLNFACPVNKALRRRRGGWLMTAPEQVVDIVRAVREAVDIPVTLKVRQKFADADDESNFWHLAEGAHEAGADAMTAHARSVEQKYAGRADWDFLRRVKEHFPDWTVIGSGDVLGPDRALAMLRETGVDATIAARGVLGNPWFFRQARDLADGREMTRPTIQEQKDVMREHMAMAVELYGPKRGPKIMRKFGIRYARMHDHPKAVRMAFVDVKTAGQWFAVLDRMYDTEKESTSDTGDLSCQHTQNPG